MLAGFRSSIFYIVFPNSKPTSALILTDRKIIGPSYYPYYHWKATCTRK